MNILSCETLCLLQRQRNSSRTELGPSWLEEKLLGETQGMGCEVADT